MRVMLPDNNLLKTHTTQPCLLIEHHVDVLFRVIVITCVAVFVVTIIVAVYIATEK